MRQNVPEENGEVAAEIDGVADGSTIVNEALDLRGSCSLTC